MSEEQEEAIVDVYNNYCDTLPHISKLYVDLSLAQRILVKRSLQKCQAPLGAHEKIKRWVVSKANNTVFIPTKIGLDFIDNSDLEVETTLRGQDIPGSIENCIFITTLYEHYFELKDLDFIREELEPQVIGYLDKGLVKLALRIRKVLVAPGIYNLVEEVVPINTTIYNEMLEKLIEDFKLRYNKVPTQEALNLLKSKAMAAVCDRKYSDGSIIKVNSMQNYENKLIATINNPNSKLVVNWSRFKREVENFYEITWEDIYYSRRGDKVNIWGRGIPVLFDNRALVTEKVKTL